MPTTSPLSRRSFLNRTGLVAAAGAAPWVIPGRALGKAGQPAPSERVTVGMIGTGRQAFLVNLQRQFIKMPDVQVVALCDVDRWRLAEVQKFVEKSYAAGQPSGQYKGCATYKLYQELLGRDDIDAVMISTPDHWHAKIAIDAAAAGKHVALEKPIIRSIGDGQAIIAAMREHGRVFRVDSEMRSQERLLRMAELVRNGRVGKVKTVRVGVPASDDVDCPATPEMPVPEDLDYDLWQGPARRAPYTQERVHAPRQFGRPGWMRVLDYCDGMITNWGTHFCDIALWCMGAERTGPVEIEGQGVWPPAGQLWNVLKKFEVTYRFADGVEFIYENTRNPAIAGEVVKSTAYVKIEGSEGWIFAGYGDAAANKLIAEPASLATSELGPDAVRFPLKSDKQDFIDAVKSGGRTLEDEEVGHRVTSLCLLGHIAIHLGQRLRWDPVAEQFPGNEAANAYLSKGILAPPEK